MAISNKLDLGAFLRKQSDNLQGYVLDLIRVSPVNDRQFTQMEKSIKKYFRETVDSATEVLKEMNEEGFEFSDRPPFNPNK